MALGSDLAVAQQIGAHALVTGINATDPGNGFRIGDPENCNRRSGESDRIRLAITTRAGQMNTS
jgi:hypothetical protein